MADERRERSPTKKTAPADYKDFMSPTAWVLWWGSWQGFRLRLWQPKEVQALHSKGSGVTRWFHQSFSQWNLVLKGCCHKNVLQKKDASGVCFTKEKIALYGCSETWDVRSSMGYLVLTHSLWGTVCYWEYGMGEFQCMLEWWFCTHSKRNKCCCKKLRCQNGQGPGQLNANCTSKGHLYAIH